MILQLKARGEHMQGVKTSCFKILYYISCSTLNIYNLSFYNIFKKLKTRKCDLENSTFFLNVLGLLD